MKRIPTSLVLFATFLLASCATVQTYEGEALPPEEVAVINSSYWDNLALTAVVKEVDGEKVGRNPGSIMVLPGEHAVKIRVSQKMSFVGTISTSGTVILNAEAGHTYKVYGEIYGMGEGLGVWIKDEENDQIVASRKYRN